MRFNYQQAQGGARDGGNWNFIFCGEKKFLKLMVNEIFSN